MNQVQQVLNMLLKQFQNNNPQVVNEVNQVISSNKNPKDIVLQTISGFSPQQKQTILNQARGLGIPTNIIEQLQNMK